MSSGQQHDRITWILFPVIAVVSLEVTRPWYLSTIISISFLFSGLMFGPDLDIKSVQTSRWGIFRSFWSLYRRAIPHRSFLSHGFLIGTIVRICYLVGILLLIGTIVMLGYDLIKKSIWDPRQLITQFFNFLFLEHRKEIIASLVGLEIGAMSHYVVDWFSSAFKKLFKSKRKKKRDR